MVLDKYLQYGFRDTMRSLMRHKGMFFVSVFTVAAMMLVLGATTLLALNSQNAVDTMEDQLEIVVFLKTDTTREEAIAMQSRFQSINGLRSVQFVDKEEALELMGDQFESSTKLTGALGGNNPLPDAYHIQVENVEQIPAAVSYLEAMPEIELVRYGQDLVENMISLTNVLEIACVAVVVGMMLVALVLINSTIRLTVAARSEEINIMKYVGATNVYVRIPFFLEGLLIGTLGALIADIALFFGYRYIVAYIKEAAAFIPLMENSVIAWKLMGALLIGGMLLGAIGSNIAVKKYLKV